ncbi:MAG: uracil-DNA glycosylase [Rubrivivax sp.]|nr:uracil-DNA glycosylase [Rubrivivax sp.]
MNRLIRPLDELLAADFGDWQPLLQRWRASAAGQALVDAVDARVEAGAKVYPNQVFRALALTPLSQVRVVILGQDPYHGAGQAEGLAFSVAPGQRLPPSLRNIFKELQRDLGLAMPVSGADSGSLLPWAQQGVLLLNATLTVEDGLAGRHAKLGWQTLTDAICQALAEDPTPKVFMLWGAHAQAKVPLLAAAGEGHAVLTCNHPSPLSALRPPAPFIGCGHFGLANVFLQQAGRPAVRWALA